MILFVGYYGFGNAGDEAILAAATAQIRERRPEMRIVVASGNPEHTIATHGVEAIAWNDMAAIHRAVQVSRLVAIGGGGLFHDYWGVDPDTFLTDRHWGVAYYAGPAALATLYRKPVMLYGVGVGPLYSGHGIQFTRMAAQAAQVITVRDEASKSVLEGLGIAGERVRVTADPAFAFEPATAVDSVETLNADFVRHAPVLGVAPRYWNIGVHPEFLERELASAVDLFIKQTGGSAVLIPFQDIKGTREDDRATAGRIVSQLVYQDRVTIAEAPATPERVYATLRSCDTVLGMRLHALIFAAIAGIPSVALTYDPKVSELSKRLGLDRFSLDVKSVEAADIAQRLIEAMDNRGRFCEAMTHACGDLRNAAIENATLAIDLVDSLPAESVRFQGFDALRTQTVEQENRTINRELANLHTRYHALEAELAKEKAAREAAKSTFDETVARLESAIAEIRDEARADAEALRARLRLAADERRTVEARAEALEARAEARAEGYAAQFRQADEQRQAVVAELDRYRATLNSQIVTYRNQRAWQVMLLFRKAYTLLFRRSVWAFLRWAVGVPFWRFGSLAEYDLTFPDVAGYIPDSFRAGIAAPPAPGVAAAPAKEETPAQRDRYDVVILAIIDFDFRFQRPQQIAAEYARQGHRVFWISPTRFLPADSSRAYEVHPLRENLWEIHLKSRQPDIYLGELTEQDIYSLSAALEPLFREWTISEHAVLVQLPFWRRLARELRATYGGTVVYDCMDDWETFENLGTFNVSEEKHLVRECDVLVVTGAELQRKFEAQGLHPVLARNGADYPFFATAGPSKLLEEVKRPVVGYFGAIADWIDLDLVREVARSRPQYSFVLIGQVFGRDTSALEALANVRLLGNKPYADIPSYLYQFDACIIPFLLNQVTKATDPVKLYEYFSLGKPVVATDMKELGQCGDLLYIGRGTEDFAQQVDRAVTEKDASLVERRIEFAKANTWTRRVEQIDGSVRQAFPKVSILIVTHNSAPFVRPCLDSIARNTSYPNYEIMLVDNASTDNTVAMLEEYAARDSRMRVFPLDKNLGFAGGNNYAARAAKGEYLLFLNIDTMVTPGWIGRLMRHVQQDRSIGQLCPVTNFAGNEVKINVSYTRPSEMETFARWLAAAQSGKKVALGVAPLYCTLMPRRVWERVGEMDTRYEIGMFEDDDLSIRVRQAGFGVYAAEDCFIHHFGQGSFSKLSSESYNRIFEANRKRFEEKWKQTWVAHKTRPGVRPAFEEKRFEPAEFVG